MLLSRDDFRSAVFKRDKGLCVICQDPAQDAHHILERRLWPDSGYYLDNGVSLCAEHHIEAEQTLISCDDLRRASGIKQILLPPHLYKDHSYDKWGNEILPDGRRMKGELFWDSSVQKILEPVLHLFANRIKYPRTFHLPWSPGVTKDDRVLDSVEQFEGKQVVATVKMDGENTTLYPDGLHARSLEYHSHPSRNWVKAEHARLGYSIPDGWRVCGENLYAKHSIKYSNLENYFLVFSIWDEKNICLSWDDTLFWSELLGFKTVPVLYEGVYPGEKFLRELHPERFGGDVCEGYVLRVRESFHYHDFRRLVGKYVRANHVQTHDHWTKQIVELNDLKVKPE